LILESIPTRFPYAMRPILLYHGPFEWIFSISPSYTPNICESNIYTILTIGRMNTGSQMKGSRIRTKYMDTRSKWYTKLIDKPNEKIKWIPRGIRKKLQTHKHV
jgi:hypothetical protein